MTLWKSKMRKLSESMMTTELTRYSLRQRDRPIALL